MNIKTSLKNLEIKLQQKNLLFVTGNIYDTFLNKEGRGTHSLLDEIVRIIKKDIKHESIQYLSMDKGSSELINNSSKDFNDEYLDDFLRKLIENIHNDEEKDKTYIVDFGDILMDNSASGSDGGLTKIMEAISAILVGQNDNYNELTNSLKQSKLIFLMREAGNVINYITNKNVEYAEVFINKPDLKERKDLFNKLASKFLISDKEELRTSDSDVQNEAAAITDGMSYKEILQLARIKLEDEFPTFKELYNLSTLRTKESAWEEFDISKMNKMEEFLNKKVYGQEDAIKSTVKTLKRSFMGLAGSYQGINSNKPKGILFYCGPTGVGKTELAKSLTEFVFGDQSKMVRFDMSEFSHEHSDQRLLGAPPGYVGFDSGGELTNAIKENPNSIILFDEIEKADEKILDKFLQILEDGRLTSSKGELINFSETFIIFTSNLGSSTVKASEDPEKVRKSFLDAVVKKFMSINRVEILNRIGKENIIPFNFITDSTIQIKMFESKLKKQNEVLKFKNNVELVWDDQDLNDLIEIFVSDSKYKKEDGGRGLMELATKYITDSLVEFMIDNYEIIRNNKKKEGTTKIKLMRINSKSIDYKIN